MKTLLLRLSAPMQAWGDESNFEDRRTRREPTKSGVIGMVASAMGRKRSEDLSDLHSFRFGVRADREGEDTSRYDFQISRVAKKKNEKYVQLKNGEYEIEEKSTSLTYRYYLYDAAFLVGLEGNDDLVEHAERALQLPAWPLFLGRRSCPPAGQVVLGIRDFPLEKALKEEPLFDNAVPQNGTLRFLIEDGMEGGFYYQKDDPVSYDQRKRMFSLRKVNEFFASVAEPSSEHDPLSLL